MLQQMVRQALFLLLILCTYAVSVYSQETPVVIDVFETITVSDTDETQQSEWMEISETVTVTDMVDVSPVPVVSIDLEETVTIGDSIDILPSLMIYVSEPIGVSDSIGTLLSVRIDISESISVADAVTADALNVFGPLADAGGPYAETEGQSIILDATGSSDADGNIDLYEWDVNSDGTYEYSSSSPTQSHTFTEQGNYSIRLKATDDSGLSDETMVTADIADSIPSADFTADPLSGNSPLTVTFTNSSTGYDAPLTYDWDFDDDGNSDDTTTDPEYIYSESGSYSVKLTARDADDSTNSLTVTNYITVTGCSGDPVMVIGNADTLHINIQSAYDSAHGSDTIKFQAEMFTENVDFDANKSVTLESGYDCDFSILEGETTMNGNMIISNGNVVVAHGLLRIQ